MRDKTRKRVFETVVDGLLLFDEGVLVLGLCKEFYKGDLSRERFEVSSSVGRVVNL